MIDVEYIVGGLSMPRFFIHISFFLFMVTGLSGLWMRFLSANPAHTIPYTHILHAHSHLAILGWAFLGVFTIFFALFWTDINRKRQAFALMSTLFMISLFMFLAFLYQGYDVFSIILSTLHIFAEYWGAIFIYKELSAFTRVSKQGKLYIYGSLLSLILSSIGPFSLGAIASNGLKDSDLFDMAIYFYLHFQYNGWLYLALIGLFIFILQKKRIAHSPILLGTGFWIYIISLLPGYLLSVLWADVGPFATKLATIGGIGQWIGILFVLLAFKEIWKQVAKEYNKLTLTGLSIVFGLLFLKSTMELGLISPMLADLIYDTRDIIIGYLHFTLLGFISIFIMLQLQMLERIHTQNPATTFGFIIYFAGFLWNEGLLFYSGLAHWLPLPILPVLKVSLVGASLLLVIGIFFIWVGLRTIREKIHLF